MLNVRNEYRSTKEERIDHGKWCSRKKASKRDGLVDDVEGDDLKGDDLEGRKRKNMRVDV